MDKQILAVVVVGLCAGAAVYAVAYPYLSGEIKAQKRQAALLSGGPAARASGKNVDQAKRRKAIADSLNEVEGKKRKADLQQRIQQAGSNCPGASFLRSPDSVAFVWVSAL